MSKLGKVIVLTVPPTVSGEMVLRELVKAAKASGEFYMPPMLAVLDSARLLDLETSLPENYYKGLGPNVDAKSFALGYNAALERVGGGR